MKKEVLRESIDALTISLQSDMSDQRHYAHLTSLPGATDDIWHNINRLSDSIRRKRIIRQELANNLKELLNLEIAN